MFSDVSGRPLLSLTLAAATRLRAKLEASAEADCVRIGVKKGGCAGMEYTMEFAAAPQEHDEIVEHSGLRLAIAPVATLFLVGTEIDYRSGLLDSGFEFRNPNVSESCGCGESVKFSTSPEVNAEPS